MEITFKKFLDGIRHELEEETWGDGYSVAAGELAAEYGTDREKGRGVPVDGCRDTVR